MSKEPELMVAVEAFAGVDLSVSRGLRLPADHDLVRRFPERFIPAAAGDEAAAKRRGELERDREAVRSREREAQRAEAIRVGTRILPSDDAIAEAAKRAVLSDSSLELTHDENGIVIGARTRK